MLESIEQAMAEGRWAEAVELSEAAVVAHPTSARAYAYLGWSRVQAGKPHAAVEPLRIAVILEPHFWQASLQLAQLLDRLGRYKEALQYAQDALKEKPGNAQIEGLIRGLERQVPEEITDSWQISTKPMFYTITMAEHDESELAKETTESKEPIARSSPKLKVKPDPAV
jgi:tetratricopeptide (TPR) repeat protein